jgi:hypothetical protein
MKVSKNRVSLTRREFEVLVSGAPFSADRMRLVAGVPEPKPNTFAEKVIKARIPCAYGSKSCAGIRFAPNGVGSKQHTTCDKGRAAMKAARSA